MHIFFIKYFSNLLRMKNVSDKCCRGNQNTHLFSKHFSFRKSCHYWDNVERFVEPGRTRMTIRCIGIACWLHKATKKLRICNTYCFFTATMVTLMLFNVTLYVHCLPFFNLLATDFFFQILAHPVFKMWVIQKPNKVALWNKRHFEERKMEIIHHV